ncbi:MAG: hypothetical protein HY290_32905, partial [Planctomycetia bacterium]|nr:hypothetical protein [Planctomycetia bacterium]
MTILLPALAVIFAAVNVWLIVRIINRKERWAKWTIAATLCLPALYVLSFGPACGLVERGTLNISNVAPVYRPILVVMLRGPNWMRRPLDEYARLCGGEGTVFWMRLLVDGRMF